VIDEPSGIDRVQIRSDKLSRETERKARVSVKDTDSKNFLLPAAQVVREIISQLSCAYLVTPAGVPLLKEIII
jgi:hypothetical protein